MRLRLPLVVARVRWTAYVGIWLARAMGLVRRALAGEVRISLIPTAILTTWLWQTGRPWWLAPMGYAVFVIVGWGVRARKRLVVEPVSDFMTRPQPLADEAAAKDKKQQDETPDAGAGLATRLVAELTHLTAVHRQVDERRIIRTSVESGHTVQPYAKVDDVSAFLDDARSAEGRVTFGPFQVPLGLILGLLGKIVRGPRIVASLHEEAGQRQLIAMMSAGGGQSRTWRVSDVRPGPSESDGPRPLDDMLTELACRIFADLSEGGLRWDATLHFSRGLSAYRDALDSTGNRVLNLKTAEREFLEARAADNSHGLASYNLGVVYTEFGANSLSERIRTDRASAATFAFQNAIVEDPERWEPYYARAEQAYRSGQHPSVVRYCDRVIALAPRTARSYDLKAMSLAALGHRKAARHCHNLALYNAWRWLMVYEVAYAGQREPKVDEMKTVTQQCLLRLGEARLGRTSQHSTVRRWYLRRSARASFRQARWVNKHSVGPYLSLAELCADAGKVNDAEKALEAAAERAPLNLDIRASLALAKARIGKTDGARTECMRVLDSPWMALKHFPGAVERVADAYDVLQERSRAEHARDISVFWDEARELRKKADRDGLDELRSKYAADHQAWNRGYVDYLVGLINMTPEDGEAQEPPRDPEGAAERFKKAIKEFERNHQQETRTLGLHAQRARALAHAGDKRGALVEAEQGIALDPLNAFERRTLGRIYYTNLGAYEAACSSFRQALLGANSDPQIHRRIGLCHLKLADERRSLHDRRRELGHAAAHFEYALELFSEAEEDEDKTRFSTHFNLALANLRVGAYAEAISHFRIAQALEDGRLIATLKLAETYLRSGAFTQAVHVADEIIKETKNTTPSSTTYGEALDCVMSLEAIRLRATWCRAYAFAERGAQLDTTLKEIEDLGFDALSAQEQPGVKAACLDCRAWILIQQEEPERAIPVLEQSIALDATTDSHYHLACACQQLAEIAAPVERVRLLRRTRASLRRSAALDLEQRLGADFEELLERLDLSGARVA
jgi:tetratricopeptide (TPR) repeat protein